MDRRSVIGSQANSITLLIREDIAQHDDDSIQHVVEKIRGVLKNKRRTDRSSLEELIIIDTIQRLGLDYYFKGDILEALERQYHANRKQNYGDDDLYVISLRFRLLRQEGYSVSPDIFKNFQNEDGKLKEELSSDVKGLLSLYEACQLRIPGEDILDEATEFSSQFLRASLLDIPYQPKAKMIETTLKRPYHKSLTTWFLSKDLLSIEFFHNSLNDKDWMNNMLHLAEIDFEMAQILWRKEIVQVSKWGEELDSTKKLGFARIKPIKWYMWCIGVFPYPNMVEERIELAKAISFIYIIDDVFDIHGTLGELCLLTQVLNRWDHNDLELLPDYMKVLTKALYDFVDNFSLRISRKHGWNPKSSLIKIWVDLCNSFLVEAKWFVSKQLPNTTEYLKNGIISSGVHVPLMHIFFLLGEGINPKTVHAMNCLPPIASSIATIARLSNDIGTSKGDGNDGSYIDCYMKEHKESAKSARQQVNKMISDAWKCFNHEYLSPISPFSTNFKANCLNFARMFPIMYNRDAQSHRQRLGTLLGLLLNKSSTS